MFLKDRAMPISVNNRLKPLRNLGFTPSLDPPKSPLRRGVGVDFDRNLVPPFLRGARGDLDLMVKQQSLAGFDVKLTRRWALGVSLQLGHSKSSLVST